MSVPDVIVGAEHTAVVVAGLIAAGWLVRHLYQLGRVVDAILYEIRPNAGRSMRDAIDRIEREQQRHTDALIGAGLLKDGMDKGTDAPN